MAGSSLPTCWRNPFLECKLDTSLDEALAIGYGGIESYGFHALETLQCMVERRHGGEVGVSSVQCLEGDALWKAGDEGRWSRELAEAACRVIEEKPDGRMEDHCSLPSVFLIEYLDGFRAAVLMLNGYVNAFAFAGRVREQVAATEFYLQHGWPYGHFSYLCLNIEEMFLTGEPQYPAERTLLTTGILDAAMESRYRGHIRIETPYLTVPYRSYNQMPFRPLGPHPTTPVES
jgi:hypothetical protein